MALIPTRVLIRLLTIHKVIELNFCATTCVAQFSVLDLLRKDASSEIKNERACIGDLSCISLILSGYRAINYPRVVQISFSESCTYVHAMACNSLHLDIIRIYIYHAHALLPCAHSGFLSFIETQTILVLPT